MVSYFGLLVNYFKLDSIGISQSESSDHIHKTKKKKLNMFV